MLSYKVNRPDQSAMKAAKARWDAVAKPLDSLGRLEKVITRIAGIQGTPDVALTPRCGLIFCADHGIVAQGVSQTDQSVTALVARAIAAESEENRADSQIVQRSLPTLKNSCRKARPG